MNKYLEKIAASEEYKGLDKTEKKVYKHAIKNKQSHSLKDQKKQIGAATVAGVGGILGSHIGERLGGSKKLRQFAARQSLKSSIKKGLPWEKAVAKGVRTHVRTGALGSIAGIVGGAVLGSSPGSRMLSKIHHQIGMNAVNEHRKHKE